MWQLIGDTPVRSLTWSRRWGTRGKVDIFPLHMPLHDTQKSNGVSSPMLMPSSLTYGQPPPTRSALLCSPGEVQGLLSWVLQLVRAGPLLPSVAASEEQGQLRAALYYWPLILSGAMDINIDHSCRRTTDPCMGLGSRVGPEIILALGLGVATKSPSSVFISSDLPFCKKYKL